MKKLVVILFSLCMMGCTYKSDFHLQEELQTMLQQATSETILRANMHKTMYAYYLPAHIGRHLSTRSASVLNDRGRQFIMNLNVASILNEERIPTTSTFDTVIATVDGEYIDTQETTHTYTVHVYEENGYYITFFESDTVQFYAISDAISACELAYDMLVIARSMEVDVAEVKETYANTSTVHYESEKIELFDKIVPESGRVEELFEDSTSNDGEVERNEDGLKQFTNEQDTSQ